MTKSKRHNITLDNGVVIEASVKTDTDDEVPAEQLDKIAEEQFKASPVSFDRWNIGKDGHVAVNRALMNAIVKDEKLSEKFVLGTVHGCSVIDFKSLQQDIIDSFCEKYDIEPIKLAVAGNGASKKLKEVSQLVSSMSPEQLDALRQINPELVAKFGL